MFLGISSYSFPWAVGTADADGIKKLTAKGLVDLARINNIGFVQYGDNLPLHKLNYHELDELKNYATGAGVQIEAGARGLTIKNIEAYIEIARRLGSPFIRMVIDDEETQPGAKEVIAIIRAVLPLLAKKRIILAIENHDRFPAGLLKYIILSTDPQWVGICLDTVNSIGAGEGIREVAEILVPYTVNLHVKDFIIKRVDHKMGFRVEGTAAGDGMLDIPWLVGELKKTGKCKTATLELWLEPEPTAMQTIAKEKQWADKSIQYLKNIIK